MSSPVPPVGLGGSCSVVYDNTLFVYSKNAFQSLALANGTKWEQLENGVPVTGATCVKGSDNGTGTALWVVGGSTPDDSYPGLQKFSFTQKSWTTITPTVKVTQNRQSHAAVYLPGPQSILVYAGSQDDPSQYSIQTFAVSTKFPFNVLSYAGKTTPVLKPLLLPWNDTSAITIGGKPGNTDVYMFTAGERGWNKYPTTLSQAPRAADKEQGTLVSGSDNSKVLEMYDMSASPNIVSRIVLQDANGRPAERGTTVGQDTNNTSTLKRDLSLADWPAYNDSAAPTYTRSGFSLAQNADGLVAISGGNDEHPVALFNQQKNTWVDSSKFFGLNDNNDQAFLGPTAVSSSTIPSATAAPTASSSAPPSIADGHPKTSVVLGATLGTILGLILLLIIALFLLRQRRKKQAAAGAGEDGEKPRLSFADRGNPSMLETQAGRPYSQQDPHNSVAIMGGLAGHKRGMDSRGSQSSTTRLVPKMDYPPFNESLEMSTIREKNDPSRLGVNNAYDSSRLTSANSGLLPPPKRTSGWSRYFSGGTDVMAAAGIRKSSASRKSLRSSHASRASSSYTSKSHQSIHDCNSHGPTEIPPLEMGHKFDSTRVSDAMQSTPRNSPDPMQKEFGEKARPDTMNSDASSALSSNPPSTLGDTIFTTPYEMHEEQNHWSPVTKASEWPKPGLRDTTTSSVYTSNDAAYKNSVYSGQFHGPATSSNRPITRGADSTVAMQDPRGPSFVGVFPTADRSTSLQKPQTSAGESLAPPKSALSLIPPQARDSGASNATVWPAPSNLAPPSGSQQRRSDASFNSAQGNTSNAVSRKPAPGDSSYFKSLGQNQRLAPINPFHRSASPAQSLREGQYANASLAARLGGGGMKPSSTESLGESSRSSVERGSEARDSDASSLAWPMPGQPTHMSNMGVGRNMGAESNSTAFQESFTPTANKSEPTATNDMFGSTNPFNTAPPSSATAAARSKDPQSLGQSYQSPDSHQKSVTSSVALNFRPEDSAAPPPRTNAQAAYSRGDSQQTNQSSERQAQYEPEPVLSSFARDLDREMETTKATAALSAPAEPRKSQDKKPVLRPAPAQRASIVEIDDSDDEEYEEPVISTASSNAAPTALTAIPVPASTAMQYTVKKPPKTATNTDMSWVSLK